MSSHRPPAAEDQVADFRRRYRVGPIRFAISALLLVLAFWLWTLLMNGSLKAEEVISGSMDPTIAIGDRIIVREIDEAEEVKVDSIVVVQPEPQDGGLPLLKRVVAGPGDFVRVVGSEYFVNREPSFLELKEKELHDARGSVRYDLGPDQYFVVGDNRAVSLDSVQLGPVTRDRISGRAVFRYAPLGKMGSIK
jgi:signal peptidase I